MDMTTLFESAKTHLLANGDYPPTLWVEFTDAAGQEHMGLYTFAEFGAESALAEQQSFFAHGAEFGREHGRGVDISSLTLISEAWVSHVKHGEYKAFKHTYGRPEHDPRRREYLIAYIITLEPQPSGKPAIKQRVERAEIVRPAAGIIDLVQEPAEDDHGKMRMSLPMYWLAGCMFETRLTEQQQALVAGMMEKGQGR